MYFFLNPVRAALSVLLLLIAGGFAHAQDAAVPNQPVVATIGREKILKEAQGITTAAYPDANVVVVQESSRVKYRDDGTYTQRNESYRKVLTEAGRKDSLTENRYYNVFYSDFKVLEIEIIKPDGSVISLDPAKQTKEMVSSAQMAENIYDPNDKKLTINIPGVQVGDIVHLTSEENAKRAVVPNAFSDWVTLESSSPILHKIYEVSGPASRPLVKTALLNPIPGTVRSSEKRRGEENVYVWEARNVPQYFSEKGMPDIYSCGQRVLVSTFADWQAVSRWYWELSLPHLEKTTEAMQTKVAELVKGAANRDEKIRRIFDFVSHQVRYMGITTETNSPGYEPHDVCTTFDARYGVCRDKAALLTGMLRLAGINAFPVLIKVGDKLDPDVPNPYFNHAITAVQNDDGTYILMDSTNENTADLLPSYLQNCSYLVARNDGAPLTISPVISAEANLLVADTKAAISEDGSIAGETTLDFNGINDNSYRAWFSNKKPDDIRRLFEANFRTRFPDSSITDLEITPQNFEDTAKPLKARIKFTAPNFLVTDNGRALADFQFVGGAFGMASSLLGSYLDLDKRRFPIRFDTTCGIRERFTATLPPSLGRALVLPKQYNIQTPILSYSRKTELKDGALVGSLDLQIRSTEIPAEAYVELKANVGEMELANRERPIFETTKDSASKADVLTLERNLQFQVKDAHAWTETLTVRKKVLTYAGKIASGEFRIPYNPIWTTVQVDYARVILPDGTVKEVQPQEKNLMDAEWTSAAPRYPAEKQLVISLPGVEIGAIIEYRITYEMKDRPFFSTTQSFFGFDPVDKHSVSIAAPEALKLSIKDNAALVEKLENGVREYSASQSYKATEKEPSLPLAETVSPTIKASSITDDIDYAKQIAQAVTPLATPTDAIRKKAASITQSCKNDREKLVAIRDFVAKNIRDAGPNFTKLPLANLSPAETTIKDGYGNTADQAILLSSLLTAANLKSDIFLTTSSASADLVREKNSPLQQSYYTKMIVRATLGKEKFWLDELSQYAEFGTTQLQDCVALPLDGSSPFKIEIPEVFCSRQDDLYALSVEGNGDALITVTRHFPGGAFTQFKRSFTEMTPEELKRYQQSFLSRISPQAEAAGDMTLDFAYPGTVKVFARVKNFAVTSGDYLYFNLPGSIRSVCNTAGNTRKEAFFQPKLWSARTEWLLDIPAGYKLHTIPESFEWKGPGDFGQVSMKLVSQPGNERNLRLTEKITLNPSIVPAGSYSSLLDINRRLNRSSSWRVLLEKLPADALQSERQSVGNKPKA